MRISVTCLVLSLVAMASTPSAAGEGETVPQNDWMVHMDNSTGTWRYVPNEIVLVPGGLVQLMVFGGGQYSLTLDAPPGYDADIATLEGAVRTAEFHAPLEEGRYPFHDKYHPEALGTLIVRALARAEHVIGVIPGGYESRFSPDRIEVLPNTEILFKANGTFGHNLQGVGSNFSAGDVRPGDEATFRAPSVPGDYPFECRFHREQGMVGMLTVLPPAASRPPEESGGSGNERDGTAPVPGLAPLALLLAVVFPALYRRRRQ